MEDIIMKKTYIAPAAEAIRIETTALMAGSLTVDGTKEVNSTSDLLGREMDFDDED